MASRASSPTVPELRAQLAQLGVEVPKKTQKAKLEELLAAQAPAPAGAVGDVAAPEGVTREPTDLDDRRPEPPPRPGPKHSGPVLLKNLLYCGHVIGAGERGPDDLSTEQIERLRRLGVIE